MAAVPAAPEPKDWLAAAADELKQGDKATIALLQESYRAVNKLLQGLPSEPDAAFGNLIYRAQLERTRRALLNEQAKLFDKLGDKVSARRLRSASRAAKLSAASDAALLRLVGEGAAGEKLYAGADITAQRTVDTILARAKLSAVPLSERIYKTSAWMNKRLDSLIASTMARGLNAAKFAKVARDWFSPSVPGGTRYAAMRLARTEINNAFHATSIAYAQSKPWVSQMEWHLSKSHPKPDKCNVLAGASPYDVHLIPPKPHPQCMCYVTEVTPSEDEWIDRFVAGEFDDYLDAELDKADQQLGIKPKAKAFVSVPIPAPKTETLPKAAPDVLSGDAAHAAVPKGLFKKGTLTPKQRKAVQTYESGWFMVLNSFMRGITGRDQVSDSDIKTIAAIDSAMEESVLPSDIQVYRGLFSANPLFGDRFKGDLTGFSWHEKAYGSTTTDPNIVNLFNAEGSDNVKLTIRVPAGVKALELSTSGKGSDANGPQSEITLQRDLEWKVVKDNGVDRNGVRQLEAEVGPISREAVSPRPDGGEARRELSSADTLRAEQSGGTSPEQFDQRVTEAAKDDEALAASAWGLGRSASSTDFKTQYRQGISRYTGSMYRALNALARGQQLNKDDESDRARIEKTQEWIEQAFAAVPGSSKEVLVFRGIRSAEVLFGDRLDGDMTGLEWLEEANTSTTALEQRTKLFLGQGSDRVLMRILVPAGSKTIQGSARGAEAEVLLDRRSRLRIVRDNGVNASGVRMLDVELIPAK